MINREKKETKIRLGSELYNCVNLLHNKGINCFIISYAVSDNLKKKGKKSSVLDSSDDFLFNNMDNVEFIFSFLMKRPYKVYHIIGIRPILTPGFCAKVVTANLVNLFLYHDKLSILNYEDSKEIKKIMYYISLKKEIFKLRFFSDNNYQIISGLVDFLTCNYMEINEIYALEKMNILSSKAILIANSMNIHYTIFMIFF